MEDRGSYVCGKTGLSRHENKSDDEVVLCHMVLASHAASNGSHLSPVLVGEREYMEKARIFSGKTAIRRGWTWGGSGA